MTLEDKSCINCKDSPYNRNDCGIYDFYSQNIQSNNIIMEFLRKLTKGQIYASNDFAKICQHFNGV